MPSPDGNGILFCLENYSRLSSNRQTKKIEWTAGNSS